MTAPLPLLTEEEVRRYGVDSDGCWGGLRTERGFLPLAVMDVDARIIATTAHTTLRQVFVNNTGTPLEATYIFPLPDRAAVTRFTMEVAGRRVEGELQERMQARRTYDNAIAQGKRASIAEEERPGTFTIRVGNLMPGEAATITLELTGPLPVVDGEVTYRFPLVVAPRYMPGVPLGGENVGDGVAWDTSAVPDASRISPPVLLGGYPSPVRLSIGVELDSAGLPLAQVRSSLHAAYADERGHAQGAGLSSGRLVVRTAQGERLNRDFILRFHLGDQDAHSTVRYFRDGPDATFALTVLPPTLNVAGKPKDVVFVVDRSGSMEGWKMVAARRATARMIDALRPHDRFQVLAFDNVVEECPLGSGLIEATDRLRYRATEWIGTINSRGGTEMAQPLARAADMLGGGYLERDRVLVFVTDGQVGNEAQLMKLLGQRLRGARVFALGIDQAVNAGFLNRLAALGRSGEAELVESEDRLDEVLVRVHRRVDAPAISELSLEVQGAQLQHDTIAPSQLPDVFPGVPATIFGRLSLLGGAPTFIVRGRRADGSRFEERVSSGDVGNPALQAGWARLHLRDLEDRFDAGKGDKRDLERRIVDVSLRYRVLCRFTAFVAVDHEIVNRGGWQKKVTQPVEQPAGWGGKADDVQMEMERTRAAPTMAKMAKAMPASPQDLALDEGDALFAEAPAPTAAVAAPRPAPAGMPLERGAPAPARRSSVLSGIKDAVFGGGGAKKKEAATSSITLYLERVADIHRWFRGAGGNAADVARELEVKLRLLLEEMTVAGVPAHERRDLEDARQRLVNALARSWDTAGVEQALRDTERVLEELTSGQQPAASGRREGFWR